MNVNNQDRRGFVILSAYLVILSETKDLRSARQMLRSAQHDKTGFDC